MKGLLHTLRSQPSDDGPIRLAPIRLPHDPLAAQAAASAANQASNSVHSARNSDAEPAQGGDAPLDARKPPSIGQAVAVLTLGEAGEILSARGDCAEVLDWDDAALGGQNIGVLLKGGLDNEVGRFLDRRRSGKNTTQTVLIRAIAVRKDGTEFAISVTTPTWGSDTRLAQPLESTRLSWTVAIRVLAGSAESQEGVTTKAAQETRVASSPPSTGSPSTGSPSTGSGLAPIPLAQNPPWVQESPVMRPRPETEDKHEINPISGKFAARRAALIKRQKERKESRRAVEAHAGIHASPCPQEVEPVNGLGAELATLRVQWAELNSRLNLERSSLAEAQRRAEELQNRLLQNTADCERAKADLERQRAERESAEFEWHSQLDAAKSRTEKLETAWVEGVKRNERSEEEVAQLRRERDNLMDRLAAVEPAADRQSNRSEDHKRAEFELRAQLDVAKEAAGYAEAALKEEGSRREQLEARLEALSRSLQLDENERSSQSAGDLAGLQRERDELDDKLAAERRAAAESKRRADELQSRLGRTSAELDRVKAAVEKQRMDRDRAEEEWRQRLETAKTQTKELEAIWAEGMERNHTSEEELARLRAERTELNRRLAAEQLAATEFRRAAEELQCRLRHNAIESEGFKAALAEQSAERERAEVEWREQLTAGNAQRKELEAAWAEAMERNQAFEEDLAVLRRERDELDGRLVAEQLAAAQSSREAAHLQGRLDQNNAELEQVQAELGVQATERQQAEADLRERLEAAEARAADLEAAQAQETERHQRLEQDLGALRQERDEFNDKWAADQLTAAESRQAADELQSRLSRNMSELKRVEAELKTQCAGRERSESDWREQLETAKALARKLETAWAGSVERNKGLEAELPALRQERIELTGRLAAEQSAAAESRLEAERLQCRLDENMGELERIKAELKAQSANRAQADVEGRQQLETAKALTKKLETAWSGAVERNQRVETELAGLRRERDELNEKLAAGDQGAAQSALAEELQGRLDQNTADLERLTAELETQAAERARAEADWREQLQTAKALTKKLETAWAGAVERNKRMEAELTGIRRERDKLTQKLAAGDQAAAESRLGTETLQSRLDQNQAELERVKARLEKQSSTRGRSASDWREQLDAAKTLSKKLETAWTGAVERNKRLEAELAGLRRERIEANGRLTAGQQAATESKRRIDALELRLRQTTAELECAKGLLETQSPQWPRQPGPVKPRARAPESTAPEPAASRGNPADRATAPTTGVIRYDLQP